MATLNNNEVAAIVNAAAAQALGSSVIAQLDLQGIVDAGNDQTVIGSTENFTKALINVLVKRRYTDTRYRNKNDVFTEDKMTYGGILSAVAVEVPAVTKSSAWLDYTSGVTTVGEYVVYTPIVHETMYGKSESWALPISITHNQWDSSFHSAEELAEFVNYIWLCVNNAVDFHQEQMIAANRNNFIGEKLAYAASDDATGCHAINLVAEYCAKYNVEAMTVDEFRTTPKALLFAIQQLKLYKGYMMQMSTRFNTAGRKRFVPEDRLVIEVLNDFESDIEVIALSDVYNKSLASMPLHRTISSWQGLVDDLEDNTIDFDAVSTINIKTSSDGTAINQSGIVAFMCDKYAVMHVTVDEYVASQRFDLNRLTMYEYQMTDKFFNDLSLPALVFYLADVAAE